MHASTSNVYDQRVQVVMLVVTALAVARATGLLVADDITQPARDAILRRLDVTRLQHRIIATLTTCPWCVSIWLGAVAAPLTWHHGTHPLVAIPALALAFSWVAGVTSSLGRG